MVRPSLPRFLNYGDKRVQVITVLQNQMDREIKVQVAARGSNIEFVDGETRTQAIGAMNIAIKANQREKINFYVEPKLAGTAQIQIVTTLDDPNNNNGNFLYIEVLTSQSYTRSR